MNNLQTFPARILEWDDHYVKTEWLINEDNKLYQVRQIPMECFADFTHLLNQHQLLKIKLIVAPMAMYIMIEDGSEYSQDLFPDNRGMLDDVKLKTKYYDPTLEKIKNAEIRKSVLDGMDKKFNEILKKQRKTK